MRKIIASLLLFVAISPVSLRAEGPGGKGGPHGFGVEERLKHMTNNLNLTSDQQTKVRGILEESKKKMDALGDQMKAEREKTDQQIGGVLNDEQKKKFEVMKARRMEAHQEKREKIKELKGKSEKAAEDAKK